MILSAYLAANRVSLTAFAGTIGRKVSTVHAWMSGARTPDLRAVAVIHEATGGAVTFEDWLGPQGLIRAAKTAPARAPAQTAA